MTANTIIEDARVARVRELKAELAAVKARLAQAEADRDALVSHLHLALMALHDFERLPPDSNLRIIDGWNAILRHRNVSKLTADQISELKGEYLANHGISQPSYAETTWGKPSILDSQPSTTNWIVFDGPAENSFCSGACRITYTGGTGLHRADRMIRDYAHAVKLLGLNASRIVVETADKALSRQICALGIRVEEPSEARQEKEENSDGQTPKVFLG